MAASEYRVAVSHTSSRRGRRRECRDADSENLDFVVI